MRTISFNHDGQYIASASEDLFIDIVSCPDLDIIEVKVVLETMDLNNNFFVMLQPLRKGKRVGAIFVSVHSFILFSCIVI